MGQRHSDIQFGDGNLESKGSESFHVGLDGRRDLTEDQMSLKTDPVDRNTLRLERLDEIEHGGGFGADAFDVVVVDLVSN